jgi:opacity protein-like surface antigen
LTNREREALYYLLRSGTMKNNLHLLGLLVLLSLFIFPAQNAAETSGAQKAKVASLEADIFLEASQYSIVIDTVPKETVVTLFSSGTRNKKWLYISYFSEKRNSQVTGFIASNRVEFITESPKEYQEITEEKNPESHPEGFPGEHRETAAIETPLEAAENQKDKDNFSEEDVTKERKTMQEEGSLETAGPVEQDEGNQQGAVEDEQVPAETERNKTDTKDTPVRKIEEEETTEQEKEQKEERLPDGETQKTEDLNLPKVLTKVSVKVPKANIRLMPTTKSSVIHQVSSGTELKHLAKTGDWHRVNLAPNEEGIVLSGYIHQNIVREIFETATPPPLKPEEIPDPEPEITKETTEPGPGPVQELPVPQTRAAGRFLWVGGGAGYTMPSQTEFAKGLNFGGTLGFGLMKYLAIELRIPYFQSDVSGTPEGLSSGRLSRLSLMLSAQVRYPIRKRYVPYLVAGGDFHWNTFSLDESIVRSWSDLGYTFEESVDHTFGFHFGAGLDVFLFENLALNLDARYYTAGLSGKWTLSDQNGQEVTSGPFSDMTLNSLQAGISVKLFLNPLRREQ